MVSLRSSEKISPWEKVLYWPGTLCVSIYTPDNTHLRRKTQSVSSFVRRERKCHAVCLPLRMAGNIQLKVKVVPLAWAGCPYSESAELCSEQGTFSNKLRGHSRGGNAFSPTISIPTSEFQETGSAASLPSTNLYLSNLNSSHGTHIDTPWESLHQPLPVALLLTLFCSISRKQQPKTLLVLDEEFSQHPILGRTCSRKGWFDSEVLISSLIGILVTLLAKCPEIEH